MLCQCTKDQLTIKVDVEYSTRGPTLKLEDDGDDYEIICYDCINESKEVIIKLIEEMRKGPMPCKPKPPNTEIHIKLMHVQSIDRVITCDKEKNP